MGKGIATAVALIAAIGCASHDTRLRQHQGAFESLGATTTAIGIAWLDGGISGTFTRTALQTTFQLVEQERTALASTPQMLSDPRGAHLSQAAEQLSRLVALLIDDVGSADAQRLRQHLAQIPMAPSGQSP
jgi:hypothetical protein